VSDFDCGMLVGMYLFVYVRIMGYWKQEQHHCLINFLTRPKLKVYDSSGEVLAILSRTVIHLKDHIYYFKAFQRVYASPRHGIILQEIAAVNLPKLFESKHP